MCVGVSVHIEIGAASFTNTLKLETLLIQIGFLVVVFSLKAEST